MATPQERSRRHEASVTGARNAGRRPAAAGVAARLLRPGFGKVLLLILAQLVFRLAAPDEDWANVVSVILQIAVLAAAMSAAHVPPRLFRAGGALMTALVVAVLAALLDPARETGSLLVITAVMVVLTPAMVVFGAVRSLRTGGTITPNLMFGVLGIYLLLGYAFSLAFQAVGDLGSGDFFADGAAESPANYLYFSFVTMTTLGYGDLAPAEGAGRALAIALALTGKIYLVTVVAMIVSSVGADARPRRRQ